MSTAAARQRIANMIAEIKSQAPVIALNMAQTGLTLLKERSIRDGISVDGAYAGYTPNQGYKSSLKSKALNAAGSSYAGSGGKGNWQGLRSAQGMKTDNVNLFYTGRMWTSIRPVSNVQIGNRYVVLVGCSDAETYRILEANLKRYGNFMKLTPNEVQTIRQDAADDLSDIINKYLR